jgi:hypothetical protein
MAGIRRRREKERERERGEREKRERERERAVEGSTAHKNRSMQKLKDQTEGRAAK